MADILQTQLLYTGFSSIFSALDSQTFLLILLLFPCWVELIGDMSTKRNGMGTNIWDGQWKIMITIVIASVAIIFSHYHHHSFHSL